MNDHYTNTGRQFYKSAETTVETADNFTNQTYVGGNTQSLQVIDSLRVLFAAREKRGDDGRKLLSSYYSNNITPYIPINIKLIDEHIEFLQQNPLPRWRDISSNDEIVLSLAGLSLLNQNTYIPFTLRLAEPLVDRALQENKKQTNTRSFKNYVMDLIRRNLKTEFNQNIPLISVFELSKTHRYHIHGIVGLENTESNKKRIATALNKTNGGFILSAVDFSEQENGIYWASNYICKSLEKTSSLLNENPIFIDNHTRNQAKRLWEELRGINPTPEKEIDRERLLKLQSEKLAAIKESIRLEESKIEETPRPIKSKTPDDDDLTETLEFLDAQFKELDEIVLQNKQPINSQITPGISKYFNQPFDSPNPKRNKSPMT